MLIHHARVKIEFCLWPVDSQCLDFLFFFMPHTFEITKNLDKVTKMWNNVFEHTGHQATKSINHYKGRDK